MSATGRGTERREADYYPTPSWCVDRLFQHVELPTRGKQWLEPSAGEGHIIRAASAIRPEIWWEAIEMRKECAPTLRASGIDSPFLIDFLSTRPTAGRFGVALGNPPFLLARDFIEHALKWSDQVVFLLSVGFLASAKRESFFKQVGVPDTFILPERPSFTDGGTDSCTYAWMRWKADRSQDGRISILYDTRQTSLFGSTP